jgi:formyl-CoA transferase
MSETRRTETGAPVEGPLAGLRVIDCATLFAGPIISTLMGDFGADVIKIEHPTGDPLRNMGAKKNGHGLWWKTTARNKRCIALDLKAAADADLFKALVADADILVENFRTGTLESWGLGWDVLSKVNPRLVMVRVTGFGQTGPYSRRAGFGTLAEAMSGFAHITGQPDGPPTLPPFGLADGIAAYYGCFASMFAIYERDVRGSGKGQYIDLAIYEPIFALLGPQPIIFDQLGIIQNRTGNRSVNNAPRNAYRTRDGRWVALSAAAPSIVRRVLDLTGGPSTADDPRFQTNLDRIKHVEEIDAIVGGWIARHDLADVLETFEKVEAAIAPIYDIEQIFGDPQYLARNSIVSVPDEDLGSVRMQNVFPGMSRTPGTIRFAGGRIDQHRDQILSELRTAGKLPAVDPQGKGTPWDAYLTEADRAVLARGRFAQRMGFGNKLAIVVIDAQRYMVGERGVRDERYPSSCGEIGWAAVDRIAAILDEGRAAGVPVFLTRFVLDASGSDIGVYGRKRTFMKDRGDWCIDGTPGAELLPEVGPRPGDIVIDKKKPSAFHGTPLLGYLVERRIDTVIVLGGATSNCVRATVFDAASYEYRAIVPADAVFDRLPISHAISLFDMDRQFADVTDAATVIAELRNNRKGGQA